MSIPYPCKAISSSLSHNLRLATSAEERHLFAAEALRNAAQTVFPELERLRALRGERDDFYRQTQEAVSELVTFICVPYVRNCTSYSSGIALLEQCAAACTDAAIRKKLVNYGNQIKSMWNNREPGGIHHAPRAARRPSNLSRENSGFWPLVGVIILAGSLLYLGARFPFSGSTGSSLPAEQVHVERQSTKEAPPADAEPVPVVDVTAPPPPPQFGFCRYTDDSGVVHLLDDAAKVPARYRSRVEFLDGQAGSGSTRVLCRGNHVIVPVTLRYQGREVQTMLMLDTGATHTTINENIAARLGIDLATASAGSSTVADGRRVRSFTTIAESIGVGDKTVKGTALSILPGCGGEGIEGLLGMNFLKEFRYNIDFKRGVIEWGG